MKKIKVLIIDDSAIARAILAKGLSMDPDIEVVGKAPDVFTARDKIVFLEPDVLTLDIEMPEMDGLEFLKRLMPQYPLPVVIVSSMTKPGAGATIEALEYGAVDYVLKPSLRTGTGLMEMINTLCEKIKLASRIDVSVWKQENYKRKKKIISPACDYYPDKKDRIIAIGASTGGVAAITKLLMGLPADIPGTVIAQHMPPVFTKLFADKLNQAVKMHVKEAKDGEEIVYGKVFIAPGGYHTGVVRSGNKYVLKCTPAVKGDGYCPSVETLFNSIAKNAGPRAVGVILTGMGKDGSGGMLRMRDAGSRTLAQDKASSVVYGMPKAAWECGGAEKRVHLSMMAAHIIQVLGSMQENH